MQRFEYAVKLSADQEAGFVVTCRDLPELITQGEDELFATYMKKGLFFPKPSPLKRGEHWVCPPAETLAKAALYVAMSESGISKVELAKRLGVDEKEVRRLLDPHYASKLPRIAQAIDALERKLVIGLQVSI